MNVSTKKTLLKVVSQRKHPCGRDGKAYDTLLSFRLTLWSPGKFETQFILITAIQ
jgi:hypothetical protein